MSDHSVLKKLIINAVIQSVPQWYWAESGPNRESFRVAREVVDFFRLTSLSRSLSALRNHAQEQLRVWFGAVKQSRPPDVAEMVQDQLAFFWLNWENSGVEWRRILDYFHQLEVRTYENSHVSLNVIVSKGRGGIDVSDGDHQKLLDPLATSQRAFIRVDRRFRFIEYGRISWSLVGESPAPEFCPEFLRPFIAILKEDEFSVHQTVKGDLIVLNSKGLLASKRRRRWHFYDVVNMRNSIGQIFGSTNIASSLFGSLFDLSYKRKGALLVYDKDGLVVDRVSNKYSVLQGEGEDVDSVHAALGSSIRVLNEEVPGSVFPSRLLLTELASMDGAVIFDDRGISAFGAMIRSHDQVTGHPGARTTAAMSAFLFGGIPVKISSDGDVTILFRSPQGVSPGWSEARIDYL